MQCSLRRVQPNTQATSKRRQASKVAQTRVRSDLPQRRLPVMRHSRFTVYLGLALSTAAACAQVMSAATGSSPVAYIYLASTPPNSKANEIVAYSAAANGSLSPVTGSPFPDNVSSMAVNGKYLMGVNLAKPDIDAFKIESDGALSYLTSTNYAQYNNPPEGCGIAGQPFFDHTGATLYLMEFEASNACANNI